MKSLIDIMPSSRLGRSSLALAFLLILLAILVWSANYRHEATLEIRAEHRGLSLPDGFYVWHHLDANGIRFKSITPHHDGLVISCTTDIQCRAARNVLIRSLPQGYTLALREERSMGALLLARMRSSSRRLG